MFKFLKNLSGKAKKIMLSVGTGVAVAGLGMYAVIQLFRLGKKLFGTAAN